MDVLPARTGTLSLAPAVAGADVRCSPNSSSRLSTTPMASATSAAALRPIATYTSKSLLVATPPISTPMATATSPALNRITFDLLVSGRAGSPAYGIISDRRGGNRPRAREPRTGLWWGRDRWPRYGWTAVRGQPGAAAGKAAPRP